MNSYMTQEQNTDLIRALARLRLNTDFQKFSAYLSESLKATDESLRSQEGIALTRLQGSAQTFESLLELIETAPTLAQQLSQ